ncbi:hypothetical protein PVAP13_4NG071600 [Panicum virgatum]|uniref:Uncharacterized protein n=1 Tax=Panicum virgatum TaxID=38727 RepID=A0A8T0T4E9_PANVG|nr:hypothetical protein PVAP13_4NG071600 [Panicum virgatum]
MGVRWGASRCGCATTACGGVGATSWSGTRRSSPTGFGSHLGTSLPESVLGGELRLVRRGPHRPRVRDRRRRSGRDLGVQNRGLRLPGCRHQVQLHPGGRGQEAPRLHAGVEQGEEGQVPQQLVPGLRVRLALQACTQATPHSGHLRQQRQRPGHPRLRRGRTRV